MINLMSGEWYKWKKSRSFAYCLFTAFGIVLFVWGTLWFASKVESGEIKNSTVSVEYTETDIQEDLISEIGILAVVQNCINGGFASIFMSIYICIWIIGEYTHGAIKNIVGKGYSRSSIFLVKYSFTVVISLLLNLFVMVSAFLVGLAVAGQDNTGGMLWQQFFSYMGIQLMLGVAFSSMIVAVSEFTRTMGAGIGISMILVIFSNLVGSGLDLFFQAVNIPIKIGAYWITNVIAECPIEVISIDFVGRAVFVSLLWTILFFWAGLIHFQRADI